MSVIIDLDRPEARIVDKHPGYVAVYGWRRELISERGVVPMSELVSIPQLPVGCPPGYASMAGGAGPWLT